MKVKKHSEYIRDKLNGVLEILPYISISETAIKEIQDKHKKYEGLYNEDKEYLNNEWGITPEKENIILNYIDYSDNDIDDLPDYVSD